MSSVPADLADAMAYLAAAAFAGLPPEAIARTESRLMMLYSRALEKGIPWVSLSCSAGEHGAILVRGDHARRVVAAEIGDVPGEDLYLRCWEGFAKVGSLTSDDDAFALYTWLALGEQLPSPLWDRETDGWMGLGKENHHYD